MRKGKYSRNGSKRTLTVLLALVLVLCCGIGGTLAYLTSETKNVTNTFVVGDIGTLEITETDTDTNTTEVEHNYVIVPGVDIKKDPAVVYTPVTETDDIKNVPAYVFVKITATGWTAANDVYSIKATIDSEQEIVVSWFVNTYAAETNEAGWKPLSGETGVYYKEIPAGATAVTTDVMKKLDTEGNTIDVSDKITKDHVQTVATAAGNIVFDAYAIQQGSFADAAAAWTEVSKAPATKP